ncbi:MAG: hypothetical protein ACC682_08685 [Gemmatimonadota bacterium]
MSGRALRFATNLIVAEVALLGPSSLAAQTAPEVFGQVGVEVRSFFMEPLSPEQPRWGSFALKLQPGFSVTLGDQVAASAIFFARLDSSDPQRSHVDAREARIQIGRGRVATTLGINTVFWGVTESRHLVDIINQTDYLESFDGEDKFGQLMALLTYDMGSFGLVDIFAMTWFRPQLYPSSQGRPGVPVPIRNDAAVFESSLGRWNPDIALRWSHSVAEFDWAVSYFHGTAREPELVFDGAVEQGVVPSYALTNQMGVEFQWTRGDWLWKAESMVRQGQGSLFAAVTAGFEHTTVGVFGSAADLGLLLEYNYDGRDNLTLNFYDNDVFGGLRLSLNDVQGSELLAGVLTDLDSGVTFGTLETSRRLGERLTLELIGRLFLASDRTDPLYWFRKDDYLQATLAYHF